jgi:hypothetical protein
LRYLIAERLPALGSAIISPLQDILSDAVAGSALRYLAAWTAVEAGDRADCISILCDEVEAGTRWSLPAAGVMARHRIREAGPVIALALSRVDPQNTVEVIGYATALRDVGGSLSDSVRQRILAESPPWVAQAVDADFATT